MNRAVRVGHTSATAYTIPTDAPEADGTFAWDTTTLILLNSARNLGFGFHIRGVALKPGGWRMPIINLGMGSPVFARCCSEKRTRSDRVVPAA